MEPGGDLGCGLLSRISSKSARFSLVSLGINWREKKEKIKCQILVAKNVSKISWG